MDCDLIQGYVLSRPVSALELEPLLRVADVRGDGPLDAQEHLAATSVGRRAAIG
jgi:hypothetical protein